MSDDVILAKCESIENCIKSIHKYYNQNPDSLQDQMIQDAIVLNLERACQLSIDLAMFLVRKFSLGVPKESREAFEKIHEKGIIGAVLLENLKKMVAFRNIAIHEYKKIDLDIIQLIIEQKIDVTFQEFVKCVLKFKVP